MQTVVRVALLLSIAAPVSAQGSDRERGDEAQPADIAFNHRQFDDAGFIPIAEFQAGNREVRRLIVRDPYGFLPIPGVEIEKRRNGTVTMRLQYREWRTEPEPIDAAAWSRLVARDKDMFAPREFRSAPAVDPSRPPPVCHGWQLIVQSSNGEAGSWWECQDGAGPRADYVRAFIDIALAARPACPRETDNRWAFQKCFGETNDLDDKDVGGRFKAILKELEEAPSAKRLAAARMALRAQGLELGNTQWLEARQAVTLLLETGAIQRRKLQELIRLEYQSKAATKLDKLRMQRVIRHWSQQLNAWEQNKTEVLRQLMVAPVRKDEITK